MATPAQRATALGRAIEEATTSGVDAALAKFGDSLTDDDVEMIRGLSKDEIGALAKVRGKLNLLAAAPALDTNTNNNNRPSR